MVVYAILDYLFILFHGVLILFNLTGWIWKGTRRTHLICISMTLLSWFGLGIFYGWGYCPCTDWHWSVKRMLGVTELPYSFIKYYADKVTGLNWDPLTLDVIVLISGLSAFLLSLWFNLKKNKRST